MIEDVKLIGRNNAEIRVQKERECGELQARIVASRPSGQPACTTCMGTARSTTARGMVNQHDRSTGMSNSLLGSVDRLVGRRARSADRRLLLLFEFKLRF